MSKRPKTVVEMSKDMFSIWLSFAFLAGMFLPDVYTYLVLRFG